MFAIFNIAATASGVVGTYGTSRSRRSRTLWADMIVTQARPAKVKERRDFMGHLQCLLRLSPAVAFRKSHSAGNVKLGTVPRRKARRLRARRTITSVPIETQRYSVSASSHRYEAELRLKA